MPVLPLTSGGGGEEGMDDGEGETIKTGSRGTKSGHCLSPDAEKVHA